MYNIQLPFSTKMCLRSNFFVFFFFCYLKYFLQKNISYSWTLDSQHRMFIILVPFLSIQNIIHSEIMLEEFVTRLKAVYFFSLLFFKKELCIKLCYVKLNIRNRHFFKLSSIRELKFKEKLKETLKSQTYTKFQHFREPLKS